MPLFAFRIFCSARSKYQRLTIVNSSLMSGFGDVSLLSKLEQRNLFSKSHFSSQTTVTYWL